MGWQEYSETVWWIVKHPVWGMLIVLGIAVVMTVVDLWWKKRKRR